MFGGDLPINPVPGAKIAGIAKYRMRERGIEGCGKGYRLLTTKGRTRV